MDYDFLPCAECLATFAEGRRQLAAQALPFGSLWCPHRHLYAFANAGEVTFRNCASAELAEVFDAQSRAVFERVERVVQEVAVAQSQQRRSN